MSNFIHFGEAVQAQFELMSKHELFVVDINPDDLYDAYQAAFPPGTNEIFRKQREHECSTCRKFIKNLGNVVAIIDGKIVTVWDGSGNLEFPFANVASELYKLVVAAPIVSLFRTSEGAFGAKSTKELTPDGTVRTWDHFYGKVAARHLTTTPGKDVGDYSAQVEMYRRAVTDLKIEAIDEVLDLIGSNSLYRGAEFKNSVEQFRTLFLAYRAAPADTQAVALWLGASNPVVRIRNSAIGTLLVDLSEGVELERAVKSFEDKVSGTNYKRPSALITPRMIELAMKTINDEGYEPSLARRFAKISDVTINNVLWADGAAQGKMKGGIESLLMGAVKQPVGTIVTDRITIDDFINTVLRGAPSMELLVKNTQQNSFMAITAPVHEDALGIFKWNNNFAWSYDGNITDSIKERVKAAGGKTDAVLRTSLAWFNYDDLDIHVTEPNGNKIWFRDKHSPYGCLDVDMNAGSGTTREAVENVTWHAPRDGQYKVEVNNWAKREASDQGFTIEVESNGALHQFSSAKSPAGSATMLAVTLTVKDQKVVKIEPGAGVTGGSFSQEKWGVKTEQFTKVNAVMLSPNHWDDNAAGNKHYFFLLDGCQSPVPMRGIYNEFLAPELEVHRKVFEVLGNKTQCEPTADQLAGVGFSSTKSDAVIVRIGSRNYHIQF